MGFRCVEVDPIYKAKVLRLRGHNDKYLLADEDQKSVTQDRDGSSRNAKWTVERLQGSQFIRLKSCCNKYLTASDDPLWPFMTYGKVVQSLHPELMSLAEWEFIKEGPKFKLKPRGYDKFLRASRLGITHNITQDDRILWCVEILD